MRANKDQILERIEDLTVGETRAIEQHYGRTMDGGLMSAVELMAGLVWALESRKELAAGRPKLRWSDLDDWSLRRLSDYFAADDEIEIDPDDPETERGKEGSKLG